MTLFTAPATDGELVMSLLRLLSRERFLATAFRFEFTGEPLPKARARFTKAGPVYTPKHVVQAEKDLAWSFALAIPADRRPCLGPLAIAVMFYRSTKRRVDGDNLMKLVLDAGTKAGVWKDDSQVVAQACCIDLDVARPRSVIGICPARSGLR